MKVSQLRRDLSGVLHQLLALDQCLSQTDGDLAESCRTLAALQRCVQEWTSDVSVKKSLVSVRRVRSRRRRLTRQRAEIYLALPVQPWGPRHDRSHQGETKGISSSIRPSIVPLRNMPSKVRKLERKRRRLLRDVASTFETMRDVRGFCHSPSSESAVLDDSTLTCLQRVTAMEEQLKSLRQRLIHSTPFPSVGNQQESELHIPVTPPTPGTAATVVTQRIGPDKFSDLDNLLRVRMQWDQYMVNSFERDASALPLSLPEPTDHASEQWSNYALIEML